MSIENKEIVTDSTVSSVANFNQADQLFIELYDTKYTQPILEIVDILKTKSYWWLGDSQEVLLHVESGNLWCVDNETGTTEYSTTSEEVQNISTYDKYDITNWKIPTETNLKNFARLASNPLQTGAEYLIKNNFIWLATKDSSIFGISLYEDHEGFYEDHGAVIFQNNDFKDRFAELIILLAKQNIKITNALDPNDFKELSKLPTLNFKELYRNLDYNRCRLPKLEDRRFNDPNLGLWEIVGATSEALQACDIRARDPALDINSGNIAIDFGTSSTVVAYEDQNGRAKLLRIGTDDYYAEIQPEHYENPTVLEFLDFPAFIKAWQGLAQQPLVKWDWVRCSHEALHTFRNNGTNPKIVGSMLTKIKQWALRESKDFHVRLIDQFNGFEHELQQLTLRNPVKGQMLTVNGSDPFDPVELYAWYLGLNINWRNHGIFLKYYMTFPVAYPKAVKDKMLAAFRRGLLRSLPASLFEHSDMIDKFEVVERGSEPIAYAISALSKYDIQPQGDDSVAYAVFDFGGGTTDFDYGYYRYANDEEDAQGYEEVFEHYEAAGDNFLGGENLLENMAYKVFKHNIDGCRTDKIMFTKPLDADGFAGSEMFIDKTHAAHTNTLILTNLLRPFWESNDKQSSGVVTAELINRDGDKQKIELSIPYDDLTHYLGERILVGIRSFLIAMRKAFEPNLPSEVHIILAGNSSRSDIVADFLYLDTEQPTDVQQKRKEAFDALVDEVFLDNESAPSLTIHAPLEAEEKDESSPTAKTGVALGLLKLCPGTSVKFVSKNMEVDEAPFAHYVGRSKRGSFFVTIERSATYGEWHELGAPRERVFNLYHTQSNLAFGNEMPIGHNELYKIRVDFSGDCSDQKVFAKALAPDTIEICTAKSLDAIQAGDVFNNQELLLTIRS